MTPFGNHVRKLRAQKGVTQKEMAAAIGVSPAFLSALEHGRRGKPSWEFIQRILHYFNIIWDEADELVELARLSHPRIVVDTAGLSPRATEFANLVADGIAELSQKDLDELIHLLCIRVNAGRRKTKPAGTKRPL